MHSTLNEMLGSAHRDELRRRACRHDFARQAHRQSPRRNARGPSAGRLRHLILDARRREVRPATAS